MTANILRVSDVGYLPLPNWVDIVVSNQLTPVDLTPTAFCLCWDAARQSVILANNARRGLEVAGGHIEPGETAEQAARRELREETGCEVGNLIPIGYLRGETQGNRPADYRYPFPVSYQQFFVGTLVRQNIHRDNDECLQPVAVSDFDGLRPSIGIFAQAARSLMG